MTWILTNTAGAQEVSTNLVSGPNNMGGSFNEAIEWNNPSAGEYIEYYQNPQLQFNPNKWYELTYTIKPKIGVLTNWTSLAPFKMTGQLRLRFQLYNRVGDYIEFHSIIGPSELGALDSSGTFTAGMQATATSGILIEKVSEKVTPIKIIPGYTMTYRGWKNTPNNWGRMRVTVEELPTGTKIGQTLSFNPVNIDPFYIDGVELRELVSTSSQITTPALLPGWDVFDNWTPLTGGGDNRLRHLPLTEGVLSQQVPGGLVDGQQYQLSMDLTYIQGTGTTDASKVYLPETRITGQQYIPGVSEAPPGTVGTPVPGTIVTTFGNLYLTPDVSGRATAIWTQHSEQQSNDIIIKQGVSGGAIIDNVMLNKLQPYGGTIADWNLMGDPADIYWQPYTPGGNAQGFVRVIDADEDTMIVQDISHLNLEVGYEVKISFRVLDYVKGEVTCHVYNEDGAGITQGLNLQWYDSPASSDGFFEFIGIIGRNQLEANASTVSSYYHGTLEGKFAISFAGDGPGGTYGTPSNTATLAIDQVSLSVTSGGKTITFNEDVRGWVSFKSFLAEQAISVGNNYYTMLDGELYKHHDEDTSRNTFYGLYSPSSVNVILNSATENVKSFNTLDYEGSQSKIDLLSTSTVPLPVSSTGENLIDDGGFNTSIGGTIPTGGAKWGAIFGKWSISGGRAEKATGGVGLLWQYISSITTGTTYRMTMDVLGGSEDISIQLCDTSGFLVKEWHYFTIQNGVATVEWTHGVDPIDRIVIHQDSNGDRIIDNVLLTEIIPSLEFTDGEYYNLYAKDGWSVSDITTNMQKGSVNEFIEKEGKWFNYIKGVDSDIDSTTDFGVVNIQGIGTLKRTVTTTSEANDLYNIIGGNPSTFLQLGWNYHQNVMEFENPVNTSLQVGDTIYFQNNTTQTHAGGFNVIQNEDIVKYGRVINRTEYTITVAEVGSPYYTTGIGSLNGNWPSVDMVRHGEFILFTKNQVVNTSGLLGYYADVKFKNDSTSKVELFSVSSEVNVSSK